MVEKSKPKFFTMTNDNGEEQKILYDCKVRHLKDSDKMHESLNISPERLEELKQVIGMVFKKLATSEKPIPTTVAFEELSEYAENNNETIYMCIILIESLKLFSNPFEILSLSNPFEELLRKMGGR